MIEGWETIEHQKKFGVAKVFDTIEGKEVEPSIIMSMPSDKLLEDITGFFEETMEKLPADYKITVTIEIKNEWAANLPLGRTFRGKQLDMDPGDLE